ncbi:M20 family metallopeptidase [Anabaena sp. UHCC 0204]|uniref:M20 family metallopeptidase n=1 Tax=Anabaena sp. UHCC 0204 TaxID=2590009 RepID=UPI001446347D|nr:M20 family metallopeptidase [Anabaena sp. UHCC 0204]MTJ10554.1 M20 family metallopeptidase [Anabaena sp. UHCC 0204]
MFSLNLENFKSDIHFTVQNTLKSFWPFTVEKIRYEPELTEIEKLVKQLEELPNVEGVRVLRNKDNSSHEIVFQILSHVDSDSRTKLVKTAISLAIKTERKLDSIFNVEDWDLGVRVVKNFENTNKNQKVVLTNVQAEHLRTAS